MFCFLCENDSLLDGRMKPAVPGILLVSQAVKRRQEMFRSMLLLSLVGCKDKEVGSTACNEANEE